MIRPRGIAKGVALFGLGSPAYLAWRLREIERAQALPILNLHRVSDRPEDRFDSIAPQIFDDLIGWLKRRFEIVTFADLHRGVAAAKPSLILSFDDGYRDFIDVVTPILKKHGVRANQNVIPDCVDLGRPPFNVMLRDFITQAPAALLREMRLPGLPNGADPDARTANALKASTHLKNLPIAEQKQFWAQILPTIEKYDAFKPAPMMRREDILTLAGEHEFGLHSYEHATMVRESDDYVAQDAARCQAWWTSLTSAPAHVYAFPNGAAMKRHIRLVEAAGFSEVLLVNETFSSSGTRLHERLTMFAFSQREAHFRALGGFAPFPRRTASPTAPVRTASQAATPRVGFLVPLLGPAGGTERVVNAIMRNFIDQGIAVDLLAIERHGALPMDLPAGTNVIELNLRKLRHCVGPLRDYMESAKPDALVASIWPLTVYAVVSKLIARSATRVLVCDHNTLSAQYRFKNVLHRAWLRASIAILYRLADERIAVSDGVADDIASLAHIPRERIAVIENPVPWLADLGESEREAEPPAIWRAASKRILTVGNLKPQKNHLLLVRAFARIAVAEDAVLMIVGAGAEENAIRAMAAECGIADRVILYGVARNPTPLYATADLFVLSSDYEGFGLVLVEALQFGLPIVSTDCPSGPAKILDGGRFGTLVPPGNLLALARAMQHALHAPLDRDVQIARAREFLPQAGADAYQRLALTA